MRALGLCVFAVICLAGCGPSSRVDQSARDAADLEKSFGPSTPTQEGDWYSLGSVQGSVLHAYALYSVGGDSTFVPPAGSEFVDVVYGFKTPGNEAVPLCDPPTPFLVEPGGNIDQPDEHLTRKIFDSYPDSQPSIYSDIVVGPGKVTKSAAIFVVDENRFDPHTWKVWFGQPVTLRVNDAPPSPFAPESQTNNIARLDGSAPTVDCSGEPPRTSTRPRPQT